MNKKYLLFISLLSIFLPKINNAQMQSWEQWWEKNLINVFSLESFKNWLGQENSESRIKCREHLKKMNYKNFLDVACGVCTEYFGFKKNEINIEYTGIDITPKLVKNANDLGINVKEGSIEAIPFADNSFEIVYARHILEHLDYYEKAIKELIRVAQKECFIVFFIPPSTQDDKIDLATHYNYLLYHNRYNREKIEKFVLSLNKTKNIQWNELEKESILHIYIKENYIS